MSLQFILGRASYGKTETIFRLIEELPKEKEKYILVPEQVNFEYEKKLTKRLPDYFNSNVHIITFSRLSHYIFNEVGGPKGKILGDSGKIVIIYKVLKKLNKELNTYKIANVQPGYIMMISNQIKSLKQNGYSVDVLKEILDNINDNVLLSKKLIDILKIYDEYEKMISNEYYDTEDELLHLLDVIDMQERFRNCVFYVDGFESFSKNETSILIALMKYNKLKVTLNLDLNTKSKNDVLWKNGLFTYKKISELAKKLSFSIEETIILNKSYKESKGIELIESELFDYKSDEISYKPNDIELKEFGNMYDEINDLAINIVKNIDSLKYDYDEIVVLVNNLNEYRNVIEEVFDIYGLNAYFDDSKMLSEYVLGDFIILLLEMYIKSFSFESVIGFLKCGLINIPMKMINKVEKYALENAIKGNKWFAKLKDSEDEDVITVYKDILTPVYNLKEKLKESENGSSFSILLYDFFYEIELVDKLEIIHQDYIDNNLYDEADRLLQAYEEIVQILSDVYTVMDNIKLSLKDLYNLMKSVLSSQKLRTIPYGTNEILIGELKRTQKENLKVSYVIGAYDGAFADEQDSNSLFSDNEISILIDLGMEYLKDFENKNAENEYLIYQILSKPSKKLSMSYSTNDLLGKERVRSYIFNRVFDLFKGKLEIKVNPNVDLESVFDYEVLSNKQLAYIIINHFSKKNKAYEASYTSAYSYLKENNEKLFKMIEKGLMYTNRVDKIDKSILDKINKEMAKTSISKLQKYRMCPFSYFMQYGLSLKKIEMKEFKPVDAGSFIHRVLEKFHKTYYINNNKEKALPLLLDEIVEDTLNENKQSLLHERGVYQAVKKDLCDRMLTTCERIIENNEHSEFKPAYVELSFKNKGYFPPIHFKTLSGNIITIEGKIDRVDFYEDKDGKRYFIVYDFKSGHKLFSLSDVYYGLDIQLLIYLEALLNKNENAKPAGVFYFHVKDPIIQIEPGMSSEEIKKLIKKEFKYSGMTIDYEFILDKIDGYEKNKGYYVNLPVQKTKTGFSKYSKVYNTEDFKTLFSYIENKLQEYFSDIENGVFDIKPIKKEQFTACDYCDYSHICQFDTSLKNQRYDELDKLPDEICLEAIKREAESKGGKSS